MTNALGQPPVVAESVQTHTPPDPRVGALALAQGHTEVQRDIMNEGNDPHSSFRLARTSLQQQCFCATCPSPSTPKNGQSTGTSRF